MISRRILIENNYKRTRLSIHNETDKIFLPNFEEINYELSDLITYFTLHFIDYNDNNKFNKIDEILKLFNFDITLSQSDKIILYKYFNIFIVWFKNLI